MDESLPFWFANGRAGATPGDINFAESYVRRRLPSALRSLLMAQNGGVSNYAAYSEGDRCFPLLPLFGVDREAAIGSLMSARRSHG